MSAKPLGKTGVSSKEFAAGISTTKASRSRAGGPNHANPSRSSRVGGGGWTPGDGMQAAGDLREVGKRRESNPKR